MVLSAVSAYYYLRVIIYMFFQEPEEELSLRAPISGSMAAALTITAAATILIGIVPSQLVGRRGERLRRAALTLEVPDASARSARPSGAGGRRRALQRRSSRR